METVKVYRRNDGFLAYQYKDKVYGFRHYVPCEQTARWCLADMFTAYSKWEIYFRFPDGLEIAYVTEFTFED